MRKARSLLSLSESIPHDKSPTGIDKEPQNSPSDHQQSCVETAFPREPQTSPSEEYVLLSSDSQLSSVGNIGAILCEPQTPTGIEYENFQYEPLDLQTTSIRLLRVLPNLSPDGLLQCSIQHATIKAEYSCLSYVWGPPDNGSPILVNGRLRRVRQNLFDFLSIARIRGTSKLFWADALCIDQDNVSERSHQVQQMGGIFSNAVEVLAWFGNCEDTADYLAYVNSPDGWIQKDAPLSRRDFHRAPYWKRAWITQEILLAQQVRLCAGHEETELTRLRSIYQWGMGSSLKAPVAVRNLIRDTRGIAKNKSLIQLVARYRYKKCHIKRDRIYSLLALCDEGSDLRVDYGASDGEVFSEALRS
ncbi:HET-domain-containing protein, partial [Lentithecium fluviatile CBS 122367]